MVNGGCVNHWLCISFSRHVQDTVARDFCSDLAEMCKTSGMVELGNFVIEPKFFFLCMTEGTLLTLEFGHTGI